MLGRQTKLTNIKTKALLKQLLRYKIQLLENVSHSYNLQPDLLN